MATARDEAIADYLRTGATYAQVRDQLGVGSNSTIARVREAYGIPVQPYQPPMRTPEETYALYAEPYGDGHAGWTGPWAGRMPQIHHPGRRGRKESALRVAFRMRHGRDPVGPIRRRCTEGQCVASAHLTDQTMRHQLDGTYTAIFGAAP